MRRPLSALFAGLVAYGTAMPLHASEETHCSAPAPSMASYAGTPRLFQSVVIAIHGWNGACSSTFGKDKSNMLHILSSEGSFDVDCFDYDSQHGTIDEARSCLRSRLETLMANGYREFSFITHSTGGIIALELILGEALDAPPVDAQKSFIFDPDDGLKLRGLYAWSAPINGVRQSIEAAGQAARVWAWLNGTHEAILPHLSPDSDYLVDLQKRISQFDAVLAEPQSPGRLMFTMFILQGNNSDWVVRSISMSDPWWPATLKPRLVDTQTPHLENVADGGVPEAPHFPALIQSQSLNLAFGLHPRFDPYFSSDAPETALAEELRKKIVNGITNYASQTSLFSNARPAVSELIGRIFTAGYRRSTENDEYAARRITDLVDVWLDGQKRGKAFEVASMMIGDLEQYLSNIRDLDPTAFGGGGRGALRRLACDLRNVFLRVAGRNGIIVRASLGSPDLAKLQEFETRMISLFARLLLVSGNDPESFDCVNTLIQEAALVASPAALKNAGLIDTLQKVVEEGKYRYASDAKGQLGDIFLALARREGLQEPTIASLRENTNWLNKTDAPLWATFMTNEQVKTLGIEIASGDLATSNQLDFVVGVINRAGSTANRPEISIDISREAFRTIGRKEEAQKLEAYHRVLNAARTSPYPGIEDVLLNELSGSGVNLDTRM